MPADRVLRGPEGLWNCKAWQYGFWSFPMGGTKLERCLPKNQHTQRKLLNFENWVSVKFSLGLYWTSRPVRKSEKLSKSRLAGNRTSRKPDVFFSGGRTFKTYGNDKIFKKKRSKIKIVFFKFVSVNWCKFSIQIHSMYQSRSHPIVNSFRKEVKVGR